MQVSHGERANAQVSGCGWRGQHARRKCSRAGRACGFGLFTFCGHAGLPVFGIQVLSVARQVGRGQVPLLRPRNVALPPCCRGATTTGAARFVQPCEYYSTRIRPKQRLSCPFCCTWMLTHTYSYSQLLPCLANVHDEQ
jgi:hypothetical protein